MNDLIEAYKGYFEDDGEDLTDEQARERILSDTAKRRLEIYCEWNGILGYSSRLYEIATDQTE